MYLCMHMRVSVYLYRGESPKRWNTLEVKHPRGESLRWWKFEVNRLGVKRPEVKTSGTEYTYLLTEYTYLFTEIHFREEARLGCCVLFAIYRSQFNSDSKIFWLKHKHQRTLQLSPFINATICKLWFSHAIFLMYFRVVYIKLSLKLFTFNDHWPK